jgi:tetratricopeptide (TPR) repeat protein
MHAQLAREKSPLIEWSFERMMNLDRAHGANLANLAGFLESIPATRISAVLTEKLADIYDLQGKPSSAIDTWQKALTLNPSPQQRIRIRRTLAEKLITAGRETDALQDWRQLLAESPDYPGAANIRDAIQSLEQKNANTKK